MGTDFYEQLIEDLELFSEWIEWEYPLDWCIDCENVIEHIREVREDEQRH